MAIRICIAINLAGSGSRCHGRAVVVSVLPFGERGAGIVAGTVKGLAGVARVLESGRHFLVAGEGSHLLLPRISSKQPDTSAKTTALVTFVSS